MHIIHTFKKKKFLFYFKRRANIVSTPSVNNLFGEKIHREERIKIIKYSKKVKKNIVKEIKTKNLYNRVKRE